MMNQVLLGAAVPFVMASIIYLLRGRRISLRALIYLPIVMGISATWAVVPDLPRLIGNYRLYSKYALDPRCDIFYWHYTIDMREADSPYYAMGLVLLLALLMAAAWRELRLAEET